MSYVLINEEQLKMFLDKVGSYIEDCRSGVDEGLYDGFPDDFDDIVQAYENPDIVAAKIVAGVEGGLVQGASIDKDVKGLSLTVVDYDASDYPCYENKKISTRDFYIDDHELLYDPGFCEEVFNSKYLEESNETL